jgi:hypothetical protein
MSILPKILACSIGAAALVFAYLATRSDDSQGAIAFFFILIYGGLAIAGALD